MRTVRRCTPWGAQTFIKVHVYVNIGRLTAAATQSTPSAAVATAPKPVMQFRHLVSLDSYINAERVHVTKGRWALVLSQVAIVSRTCSSPRARSSRPPPVLLRLAQVASGMMVLKASGAPVRAWKIDAEAFYRKIGRRPDQVWRQAMVTPVGRARGRWARRQRQRQDNEGRDMMTVDKTPTTHPSPHPPPDCLSQSRPVV